MSPPSENMPSSICGQRMPKFDCADAQSDQGLRCPSTETLGTKECFTGEPGWDFAQAQGDMSLRILRMLEGTCSLDRAHIRNATKITVSRPLQYPEANIVRFNNNNSNDNHK